MEATFSKTILATEDDLFESECKNGRPQAKSYIKGDQKPPILESENISTTTTNNITIKIIIVK